MKGQHTLVSLALALDSLKQHVQTAREALLIGASRLTVARHLRYILTWISLLELAFLGLVLPDDVPELAEDDE